MHFSKVDMPQNALFRFLLITVIKSFRIKAVENFIKCVFFLKNTCFLGHNKSHFKLKLLIAVQQDLLRFFPLTS